MKHALLVACLSVTSWLAQAGEAQPMAQDPQVEARLVVISEELRCLVCQNEALSSSHAELAEDLRREVRKLIRDNKTDTEIKAYLVERYGDFVLYRPPVKPITWLLWIGPFVILVIGIVVLLSYLRRRNLSIPSTALSKTDNEKIDALLNQDRKYRRND